MHLVNVDTPKKVLSEAKHPKLKIIQPLASLITLQLGNRHIVPKVHP
jgi:hypothetical protein